MAGGFVGAIGGIWEGSSNREAAGRGARGNGEGMEEQGRVERAAAGRLVTVAREAGGTGAKAAGAGAVAAAGRLAVERQVGSERVSMGHQQEECLW